LINLALTKSKHFVLYYFKPFITLVWIRLFWTEYSRITDCGHSKAKLVSFYTYYYNDRCLHSNILCPSMYHDIGYVILCELYSDCYIFIFWSDIMFLMLFLWYVLEVEDTRRCMIVALCGHINQVGQLATSFEHVLFTLIHIVCVI
jgi:hypothetical protein